MTDRNTCVGYPRRETVYMLTQLSHVVMAVPDLESCLEFYGKSLGLPDSGGGTDVSGKAFRRYGIGPSDLILLEDPTAEPYARLAGRVRTEVDHFALYVEDLDTVFETLQGRGILFRDRPHTTELGHRNMQRSLVSFEDPNGFTLQLSQTVDPRPHLKTRKEAKKSMAGLAPDTSLFGGIDHVSSYCTDYKANRTLYRDILGLDEFFYSTTREEGVEVATGFEQGAFAIGGTDIELASDNEWQHLAQGPIRGLGFHTDRIDQAIDILSSRGVSFAETTGDRMPFNPGQNTLEFNSPGGMPLYIAQ